MTRVIVAIPKDNGFVEFPTPDNGVIAYMTQFGTIKRYQDEAHSTEQRERRERGLCLDCGKFPAIEDLGMCESCRSKVKKRLGGFNAVMDSYNGHTDINWKVRRSWETKKEHTDRVETTCPCCGKHKDADKDYCEKCTAEIKACEWE
jgi:hypothetical protein